MKDDVLYRQAKQVVTQRDWVSIGLIQRELQLGYLDAATLLERLEDERVVGPPVPGHLGEQPVLRRQKRAN